MDTLTQTLPDYPKVEPDLELVKKCGLSAAKKVNSTSRQDLVRLLALFMVENYCLTTECNQHREARGYRTIPTFDP